MAGTGGHRTDDELLITRTQLVSLLTGRGVRTSEGGLPGRDRPRIVDDASCISYLHRVSADAFVLVIK